MAGRNCYDRSKSQKQIAIQDFCSNYQLLNDVIFTHFSEKKTIFTLSTLKNSQINQSAATIKMSEQNAVSHRATVTENVLKLGYTSVIFVDMGVL